MEPSTWPIFVIKTTSSSLTSQLELPVFKTNICSLETNRFYRLWMCFVWQTTGSSGSTNRPSGTMPMVMVFSMSSRVELASPTFQVIGVLFLFNKHLRASLTFASLLTAGADSQFLWFKNPGGDEAFLEGPWQVGLILSENECDTALEFTTLQADGRTYDVVYTTGYFSNTFNVYWTEDPQGLWNDSQQVTLTL